MKLLFNNIELIENQLPALVPDFKFIIQFDKEIFIGNEAISYISKILSQLFVAKQTVGRGRLDLLFYPINSQLDLGVIGVLCLIKKSFPSIEIVLDITSFKEQRNSAFPQKILQYGALSHFFVRKNTFSVRSYKPIFLENWITSSSRFLPPVIVNDKAYKYFFVDPLSLDVVKSFFANPAVVHESRASFIRHLKSSNLPISTTEVIYESYIRALSVLRLGEFYAEGKQSKLFRDVEGDPSRDYIQKFHEFEKNHLDNKPRYFIILFSVLLANIIPSFLKYAGKHKIRYVQLFDKIEEVFVIVNTIFNGLKEIATNVVEHSSRGEGIVIARIFEKDELEEFKLNSNISFSKYIREFHVEPQNEDSNFPAIRQFLDVNVFDCSDIGIVDCFNNVTLEKQKKQLEKFTKDYDNSEENHKTILKEFYDFPTDGIGHQIYRIVDNMGLLVFKRNIENLHGFFFVSTRSYEQGNLSYSNYEVLDGPNDVQLFEAGTHYNMAIPIYYRHHEKKKFISVLRNTTFSNYLDSDILDFVYIKGSPTIGSELHSLTEVILDFSKNEHEEKYEFEQRCIEIVEEKTQSKAIIPVIHIGCDELKNAGAIIRLIARLQYHMYCQNVIFLGLENEIIDDVLYLLDNERSIFWTQEVCILFYIFNVDEQFYFPRILYRNSERIVDVLGDEEISPKELDHLNASEIKRLPFFYLESITGKPRLLEFETIIRVGDRTLFEHFAHYHLRKKLLKHE